MKYILVTGARGGMGSAAVKKLAESGYTVFALDLSCGKPEKNVIPIEADVTNEENLRNALETVRMITDELFAVVHYAGIYMLDSLVEMETEEFDRICGVNLRGAFLVNKLFFPLLREGSHIVMTTSELADLDPLPFTGIYAVTKAALDKYAYSLAMELQLLGIKVSVIRAGAVKTGMLGASTKALDSFCNKTKAYKCNAERFKMIVDSVEASNVPPEKIAQLTEKILASKNPAFAYSINRNSLLELLGVLPKRTQLFIIRQILR